MPPGRHHLHPPDRARHRGLLTVQRAFILDSLSLTSLSGQLEQGKPDFVEILPGIMPRVIAEISARTQVPVIAGGLLRDKADGRHARRCRRSFHFCALPVGYLSQNKIPAEVRKA